MKYSTPRAFKWMLSIVFALLFSNFGFGTTNTTFYSVCTGTQSLDLNTLTNWNTSRTGGGAAPVAASDFTNTGNVFVIQGTGGGTGSPHTITLTAAWTVAGLTIEAGATLNTGAFTLTINNGTAAIDLDIFGTLVVGKNISLAGTLQVEATGVYTHSFNTATVTIPTATWVAGSTCSVTAIVAGGTTMSGFNQTFSNLTFNCPGLTNTTLTISNLTSATTFNVGSLNTGSIFVTSTGTIGTLNESNATGTANFISCAITNYNMTGAGSSTLKSCTIGTYLQSAGTVTQNTTGNNITGNFTFNGGSFVHASLPVTFSGSSPQTISGTSPITFYDLNISSSGSTVSSTNAITTANSLNVNSGTYSPATLTVTKDVVLASGSALSLSTGLSVGGNWTNNGGTFTPGTNGVTFNGSSNRGHWKYNIL
jgi:hypothetical protein